MPLGFSHIRLQDAGVILGGVALHLLAALRTAGQVGRLVSNDFKSSIVDIPLLESYPDPQD